MPSHRFMAPLCAVAMLASTTASAAPFLSGNLALTSTKYDDVKDGTGVSLAGGYEIDEFGRVPLFFEGSYYNSGKLKVKDSGGIRLTYDGFQAFGGIAFKVSNSSESRVWAKVGYYSLDGKVSDGVTDGAEKTTGLTFGFGGDWMFTRQLGARFEIEQPTKVKAIPGFSSSETTSLSIVKVGLVWRPSFGNRVEPIARPEAYGSDSNYRDQAFTAPALPQTNMLAPFAVGTVAELPAGTALLAQARPDSPTVTTVGVKTPVTLSGETTNINGQWWFVKAAGVQGWVQASLLQTP